MKKVFSDSSAIFAASSLATIGTIGLQIVATRVTSLKQYGDFVSAQSFVLIFEAMFVSRGGEIALQTLGRSWVGGRFAKARRQSKNILLTDLKINTVVFCALALFGVFFANSFGLVSAYVIVLALSIPLQSGYGAFKGLFIASARLKEQALFEAVFAITQSILCMVACAYFGVLGLIYGIVFSSGFKNWIAWRRTERFWPKSIPSIEEGSDIDDRKADWGWMSLVRNAFLSGSANIDLILINYHLGPQSTAIFKVAKSLASLPIRLSTPIWSSLRPEILADFEQGNVTCVRQKIRKVALWILIGGIFCLPIALLVAPWVLSLYGDSYSEGASTLLVLVLGIGIWSCCTGWFSFWVIIQNSPRLGVFIYGGLFTAMMTGGFFFGKSSLAMAVVVTASFFAVSAACWFMFESSVFKYKVTRMADT